MKRLITTLFALLAIWAFQACKGSDKGEQVAVMNDLIDGNKFLGQCIIRTQGIDKEDVDKAINGFMAQYGDVKRPTITGQDNTFFITLADAPDYSLICFWVNYIVYSNSNKKYNENVSAWLDVSANANGAWTAFAGQRLMFFIPSSDTEYDNVYFLTEDGQCYRQEFAYKAPLVKIKNIGKKYEKLPMASN